MRLAILSLTILFFYLISCQDDSTDVSLNYNTPTEQLTYLRNRLGDKLTIDQYGSAIRTDQLTITYSGVKPPGEKIDDLIAWTQEIDPGLVQYARKCMCGDELFTLALDEDVVNQVGGIVEVSEKLEVESGTVVEVSPSFVPIVDEIDSFNAPENEVLGATAMITDRVTIAVIDTGIDTANQLVNQTTPFFNSSEFCLQDINTTNTSFWGLDLVDFDNNPYDKNSHGTNISGIIDEHLSDIQTATANNYLVNYLPVRTHQSDGIGTYFNVLCGIYYAVDAGAHVINCSWTFNGFDQYELMEKAIDYAADHNVLLVVSMGNAGADLASQVFAPAIFAEKNNVIAVGAYAENNSEYSIPAFSNRMTTQSKTLLAPGVNIESLTPVWDEEQLLAVKSGTSFSAAFITAVVTNELHNGKNFAEINTFLYDNPQANILMDDGHPYVIYDIDTYYP